MGRRGGRMWRAREVEGKRGGGQERWRAREVDDVVGRRGGGCGGQKKW